MQSKATEKEFRELLEERFAEGERRELSEKAIDFVIAKTREAGLEFAPEPKLPERLVTERYPDGRIYPHCWLDEAGKRVLDLSLSLAQPGREFQREIVRVAFERANAYPGLRAAAKALHDEMAKLWPSPNTDTYLRAVGTELAKGPKP